MTHQLIIALMSVFLFTGNVSSFGQTTNQLYFVFLNTNPDREKLPDEEVNQLQSAHLKNIERLHSEKKLLAAGPFDGGGGLFVLQASSLGEATNYLSTDPAISANRFRIEVWPLQIKFGMLHRIDSLYEMTTLQFVRFTHRPDFSGDRDATKTASEAYMKKLFHDNPSLLVYGTFSDQLDSMMIVENIPKEAIQKLVKENPAVKAGMIEYNLIPLYIAKGTFTHQ